MKNLLANIPRLRVVTIITSDIAPSQWNALPRSIRETDIMHSFWSSLETKRSSLLVVLVACNSARVPTVFKLKGL